MTTQTPESAFSSLEEALRPKPFVIVGEMTPDQANQLAYPGDHPEAMQEQEALAREVGGTALSELAERQIAFAVVVGKDNEGNETASHYVALTGGDVGTAVGKRTGEGESQVPGYFERNNMPEPAVALESLRQQVAAEKGRAALKLHRETFGGVANRVKSGNPEDASEFARQKLKKAVSAMQEAKNPESAHEAHKMKTEVALLAGAVSDPNLTLSVFADEIAPTITDSGTKEEVSKALDAALRAVYSQDSQRIYTAIKQFGQLAYDLGSKTETPKDQIETVWAMAVGMAARHQPSMLEGDLLTQFEKSVRKARK